jgi:diguanylate cyclase (GGDEF)-like protein
MVLRSVAQRLEKNVRKSDLVFRYGGEEFIILMPHTDSDNAGLLAERIRHAVEEMRFAHGIRITVSLGVSEYSRGLQPGELVKYADMGLYKAKA